MAIATLDKAQDLLTNVPELHVRSGQARNAGFNHRIGKRIIGELDALDAPSLLETGAGATTLLFLCLAPGSLISIAPDDGLGERIVSEARARGIDPDPLRYLSARSEVALPPLSEAGETLDAALIDGNHGWPSVFVDFCYINRMLRKGGVLFVDDVHLYSVNQLLLLLRHETDYELLAIEGKFATLRKVTDREFLPDWRAEPFIEMNTPSGRVVG
jgi:hypothetical protein